MVQNAHDLEQDPGLSQSGPRIVWHPHRLKYTLEYKESPKLKLANSVGSCLACAEPDPPGYVYVWTTNTEPIYETLDGGPAARTTPIPSTGTQLCLSS